MNTTNILLVGVGGQGIILTSKILSNCLLNSGYDVKMSEVHGMAQRGGSVSTQVRFGTKVYSPIIGKGQADILIAFEKMEALRYLPFLKMGGNLIVNDYEISSAPILAGYSKYPNNINDVLKETADALIIKASDKAKELGNIKTQNIVMLGALAKAIDLNDLDWINAIKDNVKENYIEINLKAFEEGNKL